MVPSEAQENGQKEPKRSEREEEEEEEEDEGVEGKERVSPEEKMDTSFQVAIGTESPSPGLDVDMKTGEKKNGQRWMEIVSALSCCLRCSCALGKEELGS